MARSIRPYGAWPSPVTAETAAGKALRFGTLAWDGDSVFWSESRPEEGGRGAIMSARADGAIEEILPAPFSARSRVHEYGGGELYAAGGRVWFVEAETQDIAEIGTAGEEPRRLSEAPETRFADMNLDAARERLICVAERHAGRDDHAYPANFLAGVSLDEGDVRPLVTGNDFYAAPRVSPDGRRLAWLAWDLPHMPWEAAALHVAEIGGDGAIGPARRVAGGDGTAVFQPEWAGDGRLLFVWDRTGWGNLYAWDGREVRPLVTAEAELMRPQWAFGMRSWAALDDGRLACVWLENGETRLRLADPATGEETAAETPFRAIDSLAAFGPELAVIGAGDLAPPAVARLPLGGGGPAILRPGMDADFAPEDISTGEVLTFDSGGEPVHALYYPPASATCAAPEGELPPVIVTAHGGPTGMADRGFKLKTQYWTSRGFGVCDVDYSGSAGYGRAYRARLDGQWGVRDVADVAAAARHLAARGLADPQRLIVSGSSAGALTVLLALAKHDLFAAGACSYGVSDLAQLLRITHKFEGGYLYALTGTSEDDYEAEFARRSPVNLAGEITAPVIFFQGEEDRVVPPQQSRSMARTLKERGVPVAYYEFPGEGHGFRRGETIASVLNLEYAFYAEIFGLAPEGPLPRVEIDNRDRR